MTRLAELQAMSDEEIDREVATKVMGWKPWSQDDDYWSSGRLDDPVHHKTTWHPSTDNNDVAAVRVEIGRRGLEPAFCMALDIILEGDSPPDLLIHEWHWKMYNPTPRQQSIAALLAVEDER